MIPACCPQTWDHVNVMACAVEALDVGGVGAGNPPLGRLKKALTCRTVSDSSTELQIKALAPSSYLSFQLSLRLPAGFRVKSAIRCHPDPRTAN
jgi:hypothetical protein